VSRVEGWGRGRPLEQAIGCRFEARGGGQAEALTTPPLAPIRSLLSSGREAVSGGREVGGSMKKLPSFPSRGDR